MTSPIVDVSTYTDPLTTPDDGDNVNAAVMLANPNQGLANRTRYLADMLGTPTGTAEWAYDNAPRTRIVRIPARELQLDEQASNVIWGITIAASNVPILHKNVDGSIVNAYLNLDRYIPSGAEITLIRAAVLFSNTGTLPRIEMFVQRYGIEFADWVASATENVDVETSVDVLENPDGTARYVMDSGALSLTLDAGGGTSQTTGSAVILHMQLVGLDQFVYEFEITFEDGGPINI